MPNLSQLPPDILLQVVPLLQFRDAVSLSLVCRFFQAIAQEPFFWRALVENHRWSRPLACPLHEDLLRYGAAPLKGLVLHALRLERNWSRPMPALRTVASFSCGSPSVLLFHVLGTRFVVTFSEDSGAATCWDMVTGQALCAIRIGIAAYLLAGPHHELDRCTAVVRVFRDEAWEDNMSDDGDNEEVSECHWAVILYLEYMPNTLPMLCVRGLIPIPPSADDGSWALSSELVAFGNLSPFFQIRAYNIWDGKSTLIQTSIPIDITETRQDAMLNIHLLFLHDNIYIFYSMLGGVQSYLRCCPARLLPYSNSSCPDISNLNSLQVHYTNASYSEDIIPPVGNIGKPMAVGVEYTFSSPIAGYLTFLCAVSSDDLQWDGFSIVSVRLPTAHNPLDTTITPTLAQVHEGVLHVRGQIPWRSTTWGQSVLLIQEVADGKRQLQLLRCFPSEGTARINALRMPLVPFIPAGVLNLDDVEDVALDDGVGSVLILDKAGTMYILWYA